MVEQLLQIRKWHTLLFIGCKCLTGFLLSIYLMCAGAISYADNIIDNPELLYKLPESGADILQQNITIKYSFKNITELSTRLNNLVAVKAQVKNKNLDAPIVTAVNISNGTIEELLKQTASKLGYRWYVEDDTIVFSAINPVKAVSTVSAVQTPQIIALSPNEVEDNIETVDDPLSATPRAVPVTYASIWSLDVRDHTLRNALTKWCEREKWQLVWNVHADFPITTSWQIPGSFEHAVNEVLKASQATSIPLHATMHDSNHVLEIYTPSNQ